MIGDALGVATDGMSEDEAMFYYDEETLHYSHIIKDERRIHWPSGGWTENTVQMVRNIEHYS